MGARAVVYVVVFQPNRILQNFIARKSDLAKYKLSISRLELVATHMAANLAHNIKTAPTNWNIRHVLAWIDKTVVLNWLEKNKNYNQFVDKKVDMIKQKD